MKNSILKIILPTLLAAFALVVIGSSCVKPEGDPQDDEDYPVLFEVVSPKDNDVFYTKGGVDSPDFINVKAKFYSEFIFSNSTKATVYNDANEFVKAFYPFENPNPEGVIYEGNQLIDDVFSTLEAGNYRIEFRMETSYSDHNSVQNVNVTCLNSEEVDETGPDITIITPSENGEFYTDGGVDSPDFIVLNAQATDDSSIAVGTLKVYNSNNDVVFTSSQLYEVEDLNARSLNATFKTATPGDYRVEFVFKDTEDNTSTATRNIKCIYSALPGDTDA